jgi:hypothetical protein
LRVYVVDERSYVPWKFLMNMAHNWSQESLDSSGKLMSHDLTAPDNAVCNLHQ